MTQRDRKKKIYFVQNQKGGCLEETIGRGKDERKG
jgi:hypothetical protein